MTTPKRQPIPKPADMRVPATDYQPSNEEKAEVIDMPGLTKQRARQLFMRPFRFKSD